MYGDPIEAFPKMYGLPVVGLAHSTVKFGSPNRLITMEAQYIKFDFLAENFE